MKKMLKNKPAITMAELVIVIIIVAIIAAIFLAMPRKNVSKLDRAKYYIAYDMLKRLQDEQIAQKGYADIGQTKSGVTKSFDNAVNNWLNVVNTNAAGNAVRLTNGMILGYSASYDSGNDCRIVTVDVDGDGGTDNSFAACVANAANPDCVQFTLYESYDNNHNAVETTLDADHLPFRVFTINNDGNMVIQTTGDYRTAFNCLHNNGGVCPNCNGGHCFMEAIPPIK